MELSIQVEKRTLFKRLDLNFLLVIFALNVIGLINLYSATHGPHSHDVEPLFVSQFVWLGIGWSVFFIFTLLDYALVSRLATGVFLLNLAALLYTTFFGTVALGAQRWIDLGFFRYQPSETMKLALIILMAKILSTRNSASSGMGLKELALPLAVLLVPFGLVVEQPDLGTGMMLAAIGGSMILFTKVKKSILAVVISAVLVTAPMAWQFGLREYQKNRILTLLSPTNDPRGS
ncbi:MAG: FtsW/RodA/SpoVE family cell cycle protein, partial [Pseudobdellovibrionaceae bacterium]